MTDNRCRLIAATTLLAAVVAVAGCDPAGGQPAPSTVSTPSPATTAFIPSAMDVRIRTVKGALSARQKEVLAAFAEFVNAHYRFYSHPWVIDPVYPRTVLPGAPGNPLQRDSIGQIGPVIIQVLSVEADTATKATVNYCADDRAVRYLGQDGAVDITGPAGDRLVGDVTLENLDFELTTDAAADGSTSIIARWLVSSAGLAAGAKECQALENSPPLPAPTRSPAT